MTTYLGFAAPKRMQRYILGKKGVFLPVYVPHSMGLHLKILFFFFYEDNVYIYSPLSHTHASANKCSHQNQLNDVTLRSCVTVILAY